MGEVVLECSSICKHVDVLQFDSGMAALACVLIAISAARPHASKLVISQVKPSSISRSVRSLHGDFRLPKAM